MKAARLILWFLKTNEQTKRQGKKKKTKKPCTTGERILASVSGYLFLDSAEQTEVFPAYSDPNRLLSFRQVLSQFIICPLLAFARPVEFETLTGAFRVSLFLLTMVLPPLQPVITPLFLFLQTLESVRSCSEVCLSSVELRVKDKDLQY